MASGELFKQSALLDTFDARRSRQAAAFILAFSAAMAKLSTAVMFKLYDCHSCTTSLLAW